MRVLLVSDFILPTPGGLESHVRRLAGALIEKGHDVGVLTGTIHPDPVPGSAFVRYAPTVLSRTPVLYHDASLQFPPPFPDPVFRRMVRVTSETWRPDVIHAHGWSAFSSYWPGSPPLVATLHDHGLRCPKRTLLRAGAECSSGIGIRCIICPGEQSIAKRVPLASAMHWSAVRLSSRVSTFIAVSNSVAARAAEIGIPDSKVQVIHNFFDSARMPLSKPPDKPVVLFVGPETHHKGRSVAVDAFSRLPAGLATLVLAGGKTPVHSEGVVNLGYVRARSLLQQYEKATVSLVPSVWPDPCPTVVLEAMAHGIPVIGSRIGGIPDLIEDGSSGLLVPPNDPGGLADSLYMILTDKSLREKLAQGARSRSLLFDTSVVVPQVVEVYERAFRTMRGQR